MNTFRYGRDPLCLIAVGLYALNRWGLKPTFDVPFLHDHFNDLLLIPAALPLVLWLQRKLGWRLHDRSPDTKEIALHLVIWALIAEVAGPHLFEHATADWRDLVAYGVGAIGAGLWWHFSANDVGLYARLDPQPMSFERLAPHYRWLERVTAGRVLQRARVTHLAALDGAENILLVGEGTGRFLAALRERRPNVPITVMDSSARMLAIAREVAPGPTTFEQVDLTLTALPSNGWDAVVSHCFLDCFTPGRLEHVIANLAQAATPRADWLITDFALPAAGWRRTRARLIHALMYRTFRLTTCLEAHRWTDPSPFLQAQGFQLSRRSPFNHGLIHADHWQRPIVTD